MKRPCLKNANTNEYSEGSFIRPMKANYIRMKPLFFLVSLMFLTSIGFAQVPNSFNYQAVVRSASGEIIAEQNVRFRISILQNTETGTPVYVETHQTTTNKFGLANLKIGKGTVVSGTFLPTGWGSAKHFVKVEIDPNGGSSFSHLGTSELSSVPYAFHAQTVEMDEVNDADADPTNEIQTMSLSGSNLSLSKGGGTVALPEAPPAIWKKSGEDIYFNTGKVGIGVLAPYYPLEVKSDNASFLKLYTATTGTGANHGFAIGLYDSDKSAEIFNIENGDISFGTNSIYRMRILANGNIYINKRLLVGTYGNASAGLHVKGKGYPDSFVYIESDAGQDAGLRLYEGETAKWHIFNNSDLGGLQIYNTGTTTAIFAKQSNSYVGIGTTNPTQALHVVGNAYKTLGGTSWATSSDLRLKNLTGNYTKGLNEITALQPIKYRYKNDNPRQLDSDLEQVGFVAQEVQKIFPEAVSEAEDGYLDFNIHAINVAMVNAIKELKLQNGELAKQVNELKSRLEEIEALVKASTGK